MGDPIVIATICGAFLGAYMLATLPARAMRKERRDRALVLLASMEAQDREREQRGKDLRAWELEYAEKHGMLDAVREVHRIEDEAMQRIEQGYTAIPWWSRSFPAVPFKEEAAFGVAPTPTGLDGDEA